MLKDLVYRNRSYRRFDEGHRISADELKSLIDLARLSASAANLQPLKYMISTEDETNRLIFPSLAWAGYLKDWKGPVEGERPAAYIIILGDLDISTIFGCDHGIAAQSIMLGAAEAGLGGCMISSVDRKALREVLSIPQKFEILLVLALGKPSEKVVIEQAQNEIKYWRDSETTHHVPKRPLEELVLTAKPR